MAWILSIPSNSHQPRFRGGKPSWSTQSTMEQLNWGFESVEEYLVQARGAGKRGPVKEPGVSDIGEVERC